MNQPHPDDPRGLPMAELFRAEAETQTAILTSGLLELERGPVTPRSFDPLMRAAHSLKGAARIINLRAVVRVAHAMEDCFVAAQQGQLQLRQSEIDLLLRGVDLLGHLAKSTEHGLGAWETERAAEINEVLASLSRLLAASDPARRPAPQPFQRRSPPWLTRAAPPGAPASSLARGERPQYAAKDAGAPQAHYPGVLPAPSPSQAMVVQKPELPERFLRLTAENLNRLLGLAGESLVESRWLRPFADSLQRLKHRHLDLAHQLECLRQALEGDRLSERAQSYLNDLCAKVADSQQFLAERVQELELFDRRSGHLSQRLYLEVLRTRMRPFSDGVRRFPRMVRDLSRALGKEIKLEILGEATRVDRDILEHLEAPLAHLLRNAVDHGCEQAPERRRAGKPPECLIRLEARHSAGVLLVTVADDGAGVDLERVRRAVVEKRLADAAAAARLTESELLEFLFLPGFTLKQTVTEISGRGFGLDVVRNMIKSVRGVIRLNNQPGCGLRVQLQLPLTLSVLRALLVEVAGEPYAIPLGQIIRTLQLPRTAIYALEGRQHFHFADQPVGLLTAHQVLDCAQPKPSGLHLPVVVLGDRNTRYGLVVDRFLGERELVVQPLDQRLGKVQDISAAALMEDGAPVLIIEVEEMLRSIEKLLAESRPAPLLSPGLPLSPSRPKRILAVDDSLTVRELERKLLASRGYLADVAVDGMDAWNALRTGQYDLVITDVDMPRLDGIELAALIKRDPLLKSLPVLIVSYKDREQDRLRGLEAGADYYLTKGSFHDERFLLAVVDLIGEPVSITDQHR